MGWFMFNGKSSEDFGILIASVPERKRPERRVEEIIIPGRSGFLTRDEKAYDAYTISLECSTRGSSHLDEIIAWLTGSGELILYTEPDMVYHASIHNQIPISDVIYLYNSFLLQFRVQPYKHKVGFCEYTETLTKADTIINHGTVHAEPVITVYGTGDITLNINGADYPLYSVEEYITIDSEMMEVFKGDISQNSKYGGADFPRLEVGENNISWTGEVTKVEIMPKWRYL